MRYKLVLVMLLGQIAVCHAQTRVQALPLTETPETRWLSLSEVAANGDLSYHLLIERVDAVVHGKVTALSSYHRGRDQDIYTDVTLDIGEAIKGDVGSSITFPVRGGRIGRQRHISSAYPAFTLGEEVVVFLWWHPAESDASFGHGELVLPGPYSKILLSRRTKDAGEVADSLLSHLARVADGCEVAPVRVGALMGLVPREVQSAGKLLVSPSISSVTDVDLPYRSTAYKTLRDTLTVTGTNFGTGGGEFFQVRFTKSDDSGNLSHETRDATWEGILSWSNTEIEMLLPDSATSGSLMVYHADLGWSNWKAYEVPFHTSNAFSFWTDAKVENGIRYAFNRYLPDSTGWSCDSVMWASETYADAAAAIDSAFAQWDAAPDADVDFIDGGYTTRATAHYDTHNVVRFEDAYGGWAAGTDCYALDDTMVSCDIILNYKLVTNGAQADTIDLFWSSADTPAQWSPPDSTSGQPKDIWHVLAHEVGHLLGAGHGYNSQDSEKTMYFDSGGRRETKFRTLEDDDEAFVQWAYPSGRPVAHQSTEAALPGRVYLEPCYPNPFNPETTLRFRLVRSGEVETAIYNAAGQLVREIHRGVWLPEGEHQVLWDARDGDGMPVASGMYVCRITTEDWTGSAKMTLLR